MYSTLTTSFKRDFESPGRQRPTSPNQMRIAQLNEQVKQIQTPYEDQRQVRREAFQNKIRFVDERIVKTEQQNDQKFRLLSEQLFKIEESAKQEMLAKEVQDEKREKEIMLLDKGFSLSIHKEHQEKKENESRMLRQIDEKIQEMKGELYRDAKKREDYEQYKTREIVNRIEDLREEFEQSKLIRNEQSDTIIKTFGEEVLKFQELLCHEKKVREDDHGKLLDLLQQMNDQMSNDVSLERQQREASEEMLLKLLEETCAKVESTLLRDDDQPF